MGIERESQGSPWRYEGTKEVLVLQNVSFLDGGNNFSCAISTGGSEGIRPIKCEAEHPCSVCELDPNNTFILRGKLPRYGLGQQHELFDRAYYIHGTKNSMPYFR